MAAHKGDGVQWRHTSVLIREDIFSLAKKNSLTVDELRNLNNMKSSDPLLSGRKIKLP